MSPLLSHSPRPIIVSLLLYSMWLPQIGYSAYNGTKHPLCNGYLYGMSATRLFLPAYFFGCPHNFLAELSDFFDYKVFPSHTQPSLVAVVLW